MLLAEFNHLPDAANSQPRLSRAWFVVQPAMQHAAVVAALMLADGRFLLEHRDFRVGKALTQPKGRRQPYDAAADDDDAFCHAVMVKQMGPSPNMALF